MITATHAVAAPQTSLRYQLAAETISPFSPARQQACQVATATSEPLPIDSTAALKARQTDRMPARPRTAVLDCGPWLDRLQAALLYGTEDRTHRTARHRRGPADPGETATAKRPSCLSSGTRVAASYRSGITHCHEEHARRGPGRGLGAENSQHFQCRLCDRGWHRCSSRARRTGTYLW